MTRRVLALLISLSTCVCLFGDASRPNLLIITVDDMSADSMGTYGCQIADTSPNMDQLARQSLRFNYAHVTVGNCMPGRNVMWSGLYPHNNGVEGFAQVRNATHPHLVDLLKDAGYYTAIRGKASHSTPYHPYAWDEDVTFAPDGNKYHVKDAQSYGLSTERGIQAAEDANKPFCLMINISDPHKPFYAQQPKSGKTIEDKHVPSKTFTADDVTIPGFLFDDPVVRKELAHYYSSVRRADDCLGATLEALKTSGKEDSTVIIFLSDHGMPLPFAKTQLYHHSTHTPLLVHWPGVTQAKEDNEHMVSAVDLVPTIMDIIGAEHPAKQDGHSFAVVLKGGTQRNREFVVKEYNENAGGSCDPMRAVQSKQHLYLYNPWSNGERVFATATNGTQTARRMKELAKEDPQIKARLAIYETRTVEEFYDVSTDPDCLHNLIDSAEHRSTIEDHRAKLLDWMERTSDPLLDVYRDRENAEAREAYVAKKEAIADKRRADKRKNQRQNKNKDKKPRQAA